MPMAIAYNNDGAQTEERGPTFYCLKLRLMRKESY